MTMNSLVEEVERELALRMEAEAELADERRCRIKNERRVEVAQAEAARLHEEGQRPILARLRLHFPPNLG